MVRRSRISVRPNVRPGARALTSSQDAPSSLDGQSSGDGQSSRAGQSSQDGQSLQVGQSSGDGQSSQVGQSSGDGQLSQDGQSLRVGQSSGDVQSSQAAVDETRMTEREGMQSVNTETTPAEDKPFESLQSSENITPNMKKTIQNPGGMDHAVSVLQRRKRFSAMPNLAKPRVSITSLRAAVRVPKSPPPKVCNLPPVEAISLTPQDNSITQGPRSQRWRRPSGGAKPAKIQGKMPPLSPSVPASGNQAPLPSSVPAPGPVPPVTTGTEASVPPHCTETSDRVTQEQSPLPDPTVSVAKLQTKTSSSLAPATQRNPPYDRERIAKLRELIKQEQRKQKKHKLGKSHMCEDSIPRDHNKMTMRDLIYYLPESNPMKPYPSEERLPENVIPPSPNKEWPEMPQDLGDEDEGQEDEDHDGVGAGVEDQLVVPRVKVAADGTLILDEESLTVEVLKTKGPNLAEENDPIFERGSSTTYSSFRKTVYTKPWSNKETELFFVAISMVGTDFSLIGQLFPHRARTEIKNKFKKEERENSWRIDKAFKEKRHFDLEFFSKHLDQVLAEESRKGKKSKAKDSVGQKKKTSMPKGKKASAQRVSRDQSAMEELDSDVVEGDSETAEKENEDCINVGEAGGNTSGGKNGQKRKSQDEEETPFEKSEDGRTMKKSRTEANEGAPSEDCDGACDVQPAAPDVDRLKVGETAVQGRKGPEIKPAQLCRGRFQRPSPNLGARWAKKLPQPGKKCTDGDVENRSSKRDGLSDSQEPNVNTSTKRKQKQAQKESSCASPSHPEGGDPKGPGKQAAGHGGRTKPRPNLPAAQKNRRTGKPKLVTLRASLPEEPEEEELDETRHEEDFRYPINPEEQNQAPAFVPLSLRSPQPVSMEVVETVEELEISMNVSDMLGTDESEHSLCAQPVCPGAQDELVLSTEHQLDLLVDVIDFLSPDHFAGSEESYNEAARTLLTIRNPELLSLAAPAYSREVVITEQSHRVLLEEAEPKESRVSESCDLPVAETSWSASPPTRDMHSVCLTPVEEFEPESDKTEAVLKTQTCETDSLENTAGPAEFQDQQKAPLASTQDTYDGAMGSKPSVQGVLPGRRSRFPKPKPNLARTARTPRLPQCTENSPVAPVEHRDLKTLEAEKSSMGSSPKEQGLESQDSDGSAKERLSAHEDQNPCVGDPQEEGLRSHLSNQSVPPAGRARQLPSPVLNTKVPEVDQRRPSGATQVNILTEEGTSASIGNGMRAEMNRNKASDSAEDRRPEGRAQMNPLVEKEEAYGSSSTAIIKEQCPEDGGEKIHETSVRMDTEATSVHMEGDLGDTVSCQVTEGPQPTFILTLFEVSPPPLGGLDSGVDPPGTITAELFSPLVFVDEPLEPTATQTEAHSCEPVVSAEMCEEHGQPSQPLAPASEEQDEYSGHCSIRERAVSSTSVTSNSVACPVDSCESISLTLVPSEESYCSEAGQQSSLKGKKIPVGSEKGHLQLKPSSSTHSLEGPADDGQAILRTEHPLPASALAHQTGSPCSAPLTHAAQPGPPATEEPSQGSVGCPELLQLDRESTSSAEGRERGSAEPDISQQAVPVVSSGLAIRTGRKPRGFLSFISDKSSARPAGAARSARPACPRPQVNTSRSGRRAPTVSTPPSTAANSQTAVKFATSEVCASAQNKSSSVTPSKTDKEPTSVSEYFFSDIFTQVEEPE